MPNKTFDNLSDEKKEAIIRSSLKEFTVHDFDSASLNDIITEIGIAKGSFYRYFNNKQELYDYLIEYGLEKKSDYVQQIKDPTDDLFAFILNVASSYIQFSMENMELTAFMRKAAFGDKTVRDNFLFLKNGKQVLIDKIVLNQKKGILSDRFSAGFIYFCITQLLLESANYIKENYFGDKDLTEYLPSTPKENDQVNTVIVSFYHQLIDFLKNGFCTD